MKITTSDNLTLTNMSALSGVSVQAHRPPRVLACVLCQHRKIKCDRNTPCSNCLKVRPQKSNQSPVFPYHIVLRLSRPMLHVRPVLLRRRASVVGQTKIFKNGLPDAKLYLNSMLAVRPRAAKILSRLRQTPVPSRRMKAAYLLAPTQQKSNRLER